MPRGSLIVVGTGIRPAAQTTPESRAYMERADKLYFLAADALTQVWLRELNPTAESLHPLYQEGKERTQTYEEMTQRVLASVFEGLDVCFAIYGHPGVFADPTHESIKRARAAGYSARMLPGISSDACLFADLGVDPGLSGCQSFEASDFIINRRRYDSRSALILWQIGAIGNFTHQDTYTLWNTAALDLLIAELVSSYGADHEVVLYRASPFVCCDPEIQRVPLAELKSTAFNSIATLYIPPLAATAPDTEVMRAIGFEFDEAELKETLREAARP